MSIWTTGLSRCVLMAAWLVLLFIYAGQQNTRGTKKKKKEMGWSCTFHLIVFSHAHFSQQLLKLQISIKKRKESQCSMWQIDLRCVQSVKLILRDSGTHARCPNLPNDLLVKASTCWCACANHCKDNKDEIEERNGKTEVLKRTCLATKRCASDSWHTENAVFLPFTVPFVCRDVHQGGTPEDL